MNNEQKKRGRKPKGAHSRWGRDYMDAESEFLIAAQRYKEEQGLGYIRLTDAFYVLTKILGYRNSQQLKAKSHDAIDNRK